MLGRVSFICIVFLGTLGAIYAEKASTKLSCPQTYSIAVLSDIHIGETPAAITLANAAVAKINAIAASQNIRWVFITGDVTSSAYYTQYTTVHSILAKLKVPWIPIIGNHDTWIYNSTFNEAKPTGDTLFANTFKAQFESIRAAAAQNGFTFEWQNQPVHNPEEGIQSWFTNWELNYCGATYFGLDWNSRKPALNIVGYKGAWPGAELHNFANGTFQWFSNRLAALHHTTSNPKVTMFHHHPYRAPTGVPDFIYGFSSAQKTTVANLLTSSFPKPSYWGIITGHWHRWYNGTALDQWPQLIQWETEACKVSSAFSLVHVHGASISFIEKMYGNH